MSADSERLPPPTEPSAFESLCLDLWRDVWGDRDAQKNGRSGQAQAGVDIFGRAGGDWIGVQCKQKDELLWAKITCKELREEVGKALTFTPKLSSFILATTGPRDEKVQQCARELTDEHNAKGLFTVQVWAWEDIWHELYQRRGLLGRILPVYWPAQSAIAAGVAAQVLRDAPEVRASGSMQVSTSVRAASLPGVGDLPDLQPQFNAVKGHLDRYELAVAIGILERLNAEHGARFTDHTRYRYYAFKGHALRLRGDSKEAAACYFKAKQYRPDLEEAADLEVVAHSLRGAIDRAFELASELRQRWPESTRITGSWVQVTPLEMDFADVEAAVPEHQREDAEVAFGLALAANRRGNMDAALKYSQTAHQNAPFSIDAGAFWAMCVINAHARRKAPDQKGESQALLAEAKRVLEDAINQVRPAAAASHVANLLLSVSRVCRLLGDSDASMEALLSARRLAPDDEEVLLQLAWASVEARRLDEAIDILTPTLDIAFPRSVLLWAQAKAHRDRPGDRDEAIAKLESGMAAVGNQHPRLRAPWLRVAVDVRLARGEADKALDLLADPGRAGWLSPIEHDICACNIQLERGDKANAASRAQQAANQIGASTPTCDILDLARILRRCSQPELALNLQKRVITAHSDRRDIESTLSLALYLRDEAYILQLGQELRDQGLWDVTFIGVELSILDDISAQRVEAFLTARLAESPEGFLKKYLRLRLTHLGIANGRPDLIEPDPTNLPQPDESPEFLWGAIVGALLHSRDRMAAVRMAYNLLRNHPDSIYAHQAMIQSFGWGSHCGEPDIPQIETVDVDAAVLLRDSESGDEKWYVLERAPDVKPSLDEIDVGSSLARALVGRRKGDEFIVDGAFGIRRWVSIKELMHKWLFRFQRCLKQLPTRFPDQKFFRTFRLDRDVEPSAAFAEILHFMETMGHRQTEAVEQYAHNVIPVHVLASLTGRSLLESVELVANEPGAFVRCCSGSLQEIAEAAQILALAEYVVVEPTAIVTLFRIQHWFAVAPFESITRWPYRWIVSEGTVEHFRSLERELKRGAERMGVVRIGHELLPQMTPGEQYRKAGESLGRVLDGLLPNAVVEQGSALTRGDVELRRVLTGCGGRLALEAIELACNRKAVLWTDDLAVGGLARESDGCKRTWTQALFQALTARLGCEPDLLARITLCLLQLRYDFTSFSGADAILAAQEAGWNPSRSPLKEVYEQLGRDAAQEVGVKGIVRDLIKEVWTNSVLGFHAEDVTCKLLEKLDERQGGRRTILELHAAIDAIFGLYVVPAEYCRRAVEHWLRSHKSQRIILP